MSQPAGLKKILVAGDCMLGRMVDAAMTAARQNASAKSVWPPWGREGKGRDPCCFVWGETLPLFDSAGLRLINLETSITQHPHKWPGQAFNFKMDPHNISVLKSARVDFCSLANNHILDFQREGMEETIKALSEAEIRFAGCGRTLDEAAAPAILDVDGITEQFPANLCVPSAQARFKNGLCAGLCFEGRLLDGTPVACFSAADHFEYWAATASTPGINFIHPERVSERDLDALKERVDSVRNARGEETLCFISLHWGPNYCWQPSPAIQQLARSLIGKCGFDLVIGTSAHHVQGVEVFNGKPILYSCGDFVDDYVVDDHYRNDLAFAFMLHWDKSKRAWAHIDLHPTSIHYCRVSLLKDPMALRWLFDKMKQLCFGFGTSVEQLDNDVLRVEIDRV